MKKVSDQEEKKILDELKKALVKKTLVEKEELNTEAIRKIYSSEACRKCGTEVSMLSENGLCGYCEYTREYL